MFNNAVLDIAIGLVLMYLVLSLMGTVINEFLASAVKLRATTLKSAIEGVLDDPNLRAAFYDHGLIDGANKATGVDQTSYISADSFAMAVLGSIDPNNPAPGFEQAKAAIEKMPPSSIQDVLLAQLNKANGDLNKLRAGIANYFDGMMDRVTGTYKRHLKQITLIVGFGIVVVLNADSITVGTALWKDSSLRAQMVQGAQTVLSDQQNNLTPSGDQPSNISDRLKVLDNDIRPLPIGWKAADFPTAWQWPALWWLLVKLLGLTITAFAISLGAPFWFDILSKFMNVRGAGPKPDSTTATAAPTTATAPAQATTVTLLTPPNPS
jgi:hypothetical protein